MKRTTPTDRFWGTQNAAVEKLIEDFPLLLANRQKEVDPSQWEENGHAIRMRMERRLEAMELEGDGTFQWRRRGKGKGHRVFVFSPPGRKRAELKGLEHEYFFQHHLQGTNGPSPSISRIETRVQQLVPEDACKRLLILSVLIARAFGSYVWPGLFFELPLSLYPQTYQQLRLESVKIEQIESTFDQLLLKGFLQNHGTTIVHEQEIPLLYPTKAGFKMADRYLRRMKRLYPLNVEVKVHPNSPTQP